MVVTIDMINRLIVKGDEITHWLGDVSVLHHLLRHSELLFQHFWLLRCCRYCGFCYHCGCRFCRGRRLFKGGTHTILTIAIREIGRSSYRKRIRFSQHNVIIEAKWSISIRRILIRIWIATFIHRINTPISIPSMVEASVSVSVAFPIGIGAHHVRAEFGSLAAYWWGDGELCLCFVSGERTDYCCCDCFVWHSWWDCCAMPQCQVQ